MIVIDRDSAVEAAYTRIFKRMGDPGLLEQWLARDGVTVTMVVIRNSSPGSVGPLGFIELGASLQKTADLKGLQLFRSVADEDSCLFWIAPSLAFVIQLLKKYETEDLVIHEVMES